MSARIMSDILSIVAGYFKKAYWMSRAFIYFIHMQMAEETIKVGMREFPPQVSDRSLSIPKLPVTWEGIFK